jgi:GNAT superfamily N-acetyltransferase
MHEIAIRHASDSDLEGILGLYTHLNPADVHPDATRARAAWSALLGSPLTTVFVATIADRMIATCVLAIIPNLTRGARSFGVIENLVTEASRRRTGVGRAIIAAALQAAWDADCYKVMLASGRDEDTLQFYERCGFKRGGKTFFEIRKP